MEKKLDPKNSVLFSLYALNEAVSKSYGDCVEERIVKDYHRDLEKAEGIFNCNLNEFRITEEEVEYENGGFIGFVEGMTSTTSITTNFYPRKRYYNKTLFLKKLTKAILFLKEKIPEKVD